MNGVFKPYFLQSGEEQSRFKGIPESFYAKVIKTGI